MINTALILNKDGRPGARTRDVFYAQVCVFHIKPFFLPVDMQHNQCPCGFFLLLRCKFCGHRTTTRIYYILML